MTDKTREHAVLKLIVETLKLAPKLQFEGDQLTRDLELTSSRWGVLGIVASAEKTLTVADLARRMNLKPQTVQRFVAAMAKKGFIRLVDNPDHKRARLVQLTDKGKNTLSILNKKQLKWASSIADGLSTTEIDRASSLLAQLREKITL